MFLRFALILLATKYIYDKGYKTEIWNLHSIAINRQLLDDCQILAGWLPDDCWRTAG